MILHADARAIPLADQSVGGIITSPPYNIGKAYPCDNWPTWEDYIGFLRQVYAECRRVCRGPVVWILPLCLRGKFPYAEVGEWDFATPVLAGTESLVAPEKMGRRYTRAYLGVELMVCTHRPKPGIWIVFAPQPFIGATERNRPRHPAPFVREVPGSAMQMFPDVTCWLDPFGGTGTTAMAAQVRGLRWITMDLEWYWCEVARRELAQEALCL